MLDARADVSVTDDRLHSPLDVAANEECAQAIRSQAHGNSHDSPASSSVSNADAEVSAADDATVSSAAPDASTPAAPESRGEAVLRLADMLRSGEITEAEMLAAIADLDAVDRIGVGMKVVRAGAFESKCGLLNASSCCACVFGGCAIDKPLTDFLILGCRQRWRSRPNGHECRRRSRIIDAWIIGW